MNREIKRSITRHLTLPKKLFFFKGWATRTDNVPAVEIDEWNFSDNIDKLKASLARQFELKRFILLI